MKTSLTAIALIGFAFAGTATASTSTPTTGASAANDIVFAKKCKRGYARDRATKKCVRIPRGSSSGSSTRGSS